MNAYDLADDAKNISNAIEALEFVQKAVPMLRQQADRIAELEKSHPVKQLTLDMIYKVSEATPINNEDEWFDNFAKNLIKEITE